MLDFWKKSAYGALIAALCVVSATGAHAQAAGNSTTVTGTVLDPSGAAVTNASVEIRNPVSQFDRTAKTDASGKFTIANVPFNPYHLTVNATGFAPYVQDVEVRSVVLQPLSINLQIKGSSENITVEASAEDLLENDPTFHTDVDKSLFDKLPLESTSSSLSSLVTLATPGVAADSNGLFHGLGDHAENSFSVDGQPITDQVSKVFSNQLPVDSVQSMEVISGAPPAEYGDKTSVVVNVTTRSGQGVTTPHGSVTTSYGSFGTSNLAADLAYGGKSWGNFISVSGMNTGRFLDPPEFTVMHDKGNQESVFDRVDLQPGANDTLHLNLSYSRSWFQTPNSFDAENATAWSGLDGVLPTLQNYAGIGPNGVLVGSTDQRSKIGTFNIAPSWTHVLSNNSVFTFGGFVRRDGYNYYPSSDAFADLGPPTLQRESVAQDRSLTNAGVRSDLSYVKGINNIKIGASYEQTFLRENDSLGIVDPIFNAPCIAPYITPLSATGYVPVPGFSSPSDCTGVNQPNIPSNPNAPNSALYPTYSTVLRPFDLTRGGTDYTFVGRTDVKELSMYLQDDVTKGAWSLNLGIRGDLYNGMTSAREAEPRLGVAYNVKRTNTILRASYARTLETPFNENLVLSSVGCTNPVLGPQNGIAGSGFLSCFSNSLTPISPGFRNEFHLGFEQAFRKYLVFSGEWITKYTHNGYDFSVLGNTPITFPIEWHNSKIPGYAGRVSVPNLHGFSALVVFSSVAARFFTPQVGGAGSVPIVSGTGFVPFRIDHDEHFNQTTHFQYQPWKNAPWLGFNWRYDSGLVAGASPCYGTLPTNTCPGSVLIGGVPNVSLVAPNIGALPLSADQEFEAGFYCGGLHATPTTPLPFNCPASQFGSGLIKVPGPNAENDDKNPPRIAQRSLFDLALGDDNLFHGDKYKWSAQVTVINLANNYALYNFLSTFSGTHYVTPRTVTGQIGFNF